MKKTLLTLAAMLAFTSLTTLQANAVTVVSKDKKATATSSSATTKKDTKSVSASEKTVKAKKKKIVRRKKQKVATAPRVYRSDILRMLIMKSNDIQVVTQRASGDGLELSQYSLAQILEQEKQLGSKVRYDQFSCYDLISEPSTICMLKVEQKSTDPKVSNILSIALRVESNNLTSETAQNKEIKMLQVVDNASIRTDSSSHEVVPDQSVLVIEQSYSDL